MVIALYTDAISTGKQPSSVLVVFPQCALDLPVGVPLGDGIPLVVLRFALAQAQLQLHAAVFEVDFQGNEGVPLAHDEGIQFADFALVHQELLGTHGVAVEDVSVLVGADVHPLDPDFPLAHLRPGFLQIDPPLPDGLDLRAKQFQAALIALLHEIIVPGFAIDGHGLHAILVRHIFRLPFLHDFVVRIL